jgi:hypothetical protein
MKVLHTESDSLPNPTRTFFTVRQFAEKHPFTSEAGLRYQIFNAKTNGLDSARAIVRLGRRVLIDEDNYFSWIESKQQDYQIAGEVAQ